MNKIYTFLPFILFLVFPVDGLQAKSRFSKAEMAALPDYCSDKITRKREEYWNSVFGRSSWRHGHHYCYALVFMDRVRKGQKKYIGNALGNFKYVDNTWSKTFILRPQMHLYMGEMYEMHRNGAEAAKNYNKAITLKPKVPAGYLALSRYYEKNGAVADAIEVLEEGLRHAPESKSLQKSLSRLKN